MSQLATRSYRDLRAQSAAASPTKAIVLLYERLLVDLKRAEHYIKERKPVEKGECLLHAGDIVQELLMSLDIEKGGDLARDLTALYVYLDREIREIDATRDLERLSKVIGVVETLHGAWQKAYESITSA